MANDPKHLPFGVDDEKTQLTPMGSAVPTEAIPPERTPTLLPNPDLVRKSRRSVITTVRRQYAIVVTSSVNTHPDESRTYFGEPAYSLWGLARQMWRVLRALRRAQRHGVW